MIIEEKVTNNTQEVQFIDQIKKTNNNETQYNRIIDSDERDFNSSLILALDKIKITVPDLNYDPSLIIREANKKNENNKAIIREREISNHIEKMTNINNEENSYIEDHKKNPLRQIDEINEDKFYNITSGHLYYDEKYFKNDNKENISHCGKDNKNDVLNYHIDLIQKNIINNEIKEIREISYLSNEDNYKNDIQSNYKNTENREDGVSHNEKMDEEKSEFNCIIGKKCDITINKNIVKHKTKLKKLVKEI